jgi:Fur family peroxide stress response transcriptional regulator
MHQSDEALISLLHQRGLKATPQRLAIFRYLAHNETHPSADTIYADIKKDLPTISQGTVYNTLAILADIGVIRELKIGNGHSRYDSNTDVHINVICPNCNRITDYQSKEIFSLWETISKDIGGEITGQRLDVYKKCKDCS